MSGTSISFGEILFRATPRDQQQFETLPPDITIGMCGPNNHGLCRNRPASAMKKAKISGIALAVDRLLSGRANAFESTDEPHYVYCEYMTLKDIEEKKTSHRCVTFDGHSFKQHNKASSYIDLCIALLAYGLHSKVDGYKETKEVFELFYNAFVGKDLEKTTEFLYRLCDALYYESLQVFTSQEFATYDNLNVQLIQQSARTKKLQEIPLIEIVDDRLVMSVKLDDKKENEKRISDQLMYQECKAGTFILDHTWNYERQKYIPDLSDLDEFVPNECYYTMVQLIQHELATVMERMNQAKFGNEAIQDNYVNCQFIGRPGTGKSTIASALGATFGMPVRVIINSKNTEEDTFQGMTKVQEGGFTFVPTPFLDAYKNGGIIILEEYNLTDPGVAMGALGQAIEKPFILLEDGYKEVRRNELCVIIATANTGTQGSREPSEALTSRLPHVFLLDDPKEGEFIQILQKRSGSELKMCNKVYEAYQKILDYLTSPQINQEDVALSITLRHCLAALKQIEIGRSFKQAITNTIVGTIAIKDIDLSRKVLSDVVEPMKR